MSQSDWYRDRVAECDRRAFASRDPVTRSRHIKDRESWRAIADNIEAEEKLQNKQKAKLRLFRRDQASPATAL